MDAVLEVFAVEFIVEIGGMEQEVGLGNHEYCL